MSEKEILILRLVIAGINGLFFAIGTAVLLDRLKLRPDRIRKRLARLIAMQSDDPEGNGKDNRVSPEPERLREIKLLKQKLRNYYRSPQTLIYAGFGGLCVALSLLSLMSLLYPTSSFFIH